MPAIRDRIEAAVAERVERLERERAEFNYQTIATAVPYGATVFDVGAWTGYVGELLNERHGAQVIGFDVVDGHKSALPFKLFDGTHLPAPDQSSDIVLLLYVLHHARDAAALLQEARRVCRPGGHILVAEDSVDGFWNRCLTVGFHLWLKLVAKMGWEGQFRTIPEWKRFFSDHGFSLLQTRRLGHHLGRRFWPQNVLFVLSV